MSRLLGRGTLLKSASEAGAPTSEFPSHIYIYTNLSYTYIYIHIYILHIHICINILVHARPRLQLFLHLGLRGGQCWSIFAIHYTHTHTQRAAEHVLRMQHSNASTFQIKANQCHIHEQKPDVQRPVLTIKPTVRSIPLICFCFGYVAFTHFGF